MPNEKMLSCYTCGQREPHRQPRDDQERNHIRSLKQLKPHAFVDDYWICVTTDRDCRNIRYAWVDNPFHPPEKMPEPE
ncbi:hypothetical protein ACH4TV_05350 [Streptomyces sp. NPDC020898]|uniref:hypothetical protein n=1 Tax=Streptomyces sp. NPDC020898 TaxID=3365101 RepID=UPI0037AED8C5